MPQRFTEVTDFAQVARRGKNWATFNTSKWRLPHLSSLNTFGDPNGTATQLVRHVEPPSGMARYVLVTAIALFALHFLLSRVLTRKYLHKYGHAD